MDDLTFGDYLRSLRKKQDPPMTQSDLALLIGRTPMTISQFEIGKNAPPQGDLLEKIISVMRLTAEQANQLRFLSSKSRKAIPSDIEKYFFSHPSIYRVIYEAQKLKKDDTFWNEISERIGNSYE